MANVLLVSVSSVAFNGTDTLMVDGNVSTQESGATHDLGAFSRTISIKTLGVYNTSIQLNNKILDEGQDFAADAGHNLSWTVRYLGGGFGILGLV
jgi:hypothetical protein